MKTLKGSDHATLRKRARSTHPNADHLLETLVERYGSIKDAFSLLSDGYCGACRMQAPRADLYRIHAGAVIACDSCDRFLYVPDAEKHQAVNLT